MRPVRRFALVGSLCLLAACSVKPPAMDESHATHDMDGTAMPVVGHAMAPAQDPAIPAGALQAKERLDKSPRHGEWAKIAWEPGSKDSLMAWVVYPEKKRQAPVVVVIHEIFGLSTWVRGVADQVAADGFIAIAPDLVSRVRGGPSTTEISGDSARRLISGVDMAERMRGVTAVANYAMSQPSAAPRYGVIGYCWGGSTTWGAAVNNGKGFSGGVAFYGNFPFLVDGKPVADSMKKIAKPMMLLSGSKDARIGATMPAIDSTMTALGKDYVGKNYEGAVHGFLRAQNDPKQPTRDEAEEAANVAATTDGWPRTIAFLRKNLGAN